MLRTSSLCSSLVQIAAILSVLATATRSVPSPRQCEVWTGVIELSGDSPRYLDTAPDTSPETRVFQPVNTVSDAGLFQFNPCDGNEFNIQCIVSVVTATSMLSARWLICDQQNCGQGDDTYLGGVLFAGANSASILDSYPGAYLALIPAGLSRTNIHHIYALTDLHPLSLSPIWYCAARTDLI